MDGPLYVDEHVMMHDAATDDDYFYLLQELYTVAGLVDEDGELVEAHAYDAYGDVRIFDLTGPTLTELDVSAVGNPYYFTGRRRDPIHNPLASPVSYRPLYHYRARAYDPLHGRFLQRDPAEYVDGMNLYECVRSAPTTHTDPWGNNVEWQNIKRPEEVLDQSRHALDVANAASSAAWQARYHLPAIGRKLRRLSDRERSIVEPPVEQALTQFAQLAALGIGFSPGGTGQVSERNRFVYTCQSGWIDMGHFYISAFSAYALEERRAMIAGYLMEIFQEAWRLSGRSDGWANSAFTIEDLPSDKLGVQLGQLIRGGTPALNGQLTALDQLSNQIESSSGWQRTALQAEQVILASRVRSSQVFDILQYMESFFEHHGAITNLDKRFPIEGGKDVRTILKDDIERVNGDYPGPGSRNFSTSPRFIRCHHIICTPNGKPR